MKVKKKRKWQNTGDPGGMGVQLHSTQAGDKIERNGMMAEKKSLPASL